MRVYRSPLRLFVFGLAGVVLIIAAVDVLFGHWVSTPPENTAGILTTRGQAQERGDILWGGTMAVVGVVLAGGGIAELIRRKPRCVLSSNGIEVPIGEWEHEEFIPWGDVVEVSAGVDVDRFDGSTREVLILKVRVPSKLPEQPHGAEWFGDELHVEADDWTKDVDDVVASAQAALSHHRRVEEIKQMGPPSITWEITVSPDTSALVADEQAGDDPAGDGMAESPAGQRPLDEDGDQHGGATSFLALEDTSAGGRGDDAGEPGDTDDDAQEGGGA